MISAFFQEWVSENEDYFGGLGDGILELDDSGVESEPGLKNYDFLTKTGKPTETFELVSIPVIISTKFLRSVVYQGPILYNNLSLGLV